MVLLVFALAALPQRVQAAANFVYHEQSTRSALEDATSTDCSTAQPYLDLLAPSSTQAYVLRFRVEYHLSTDQARVYYTTDGSSPVASLGNGSNTTQVLVADHSCTATDTGNVTDICRATIPAQFSGTTVKYIVSAWSSGDNVEVFANSGACIGCMGFTNSAQASLFQYTATGPPGITTQPQSRTNDAGTSASFSVTAAGLPPLTYQWRFNASNALANATNSSFVLAAVQKTNAGNYQVVVSNSYGMVTSQVATLTVGRPPSITQQPMSLIVTQGATASFSVSVSGDQPLSYQWYLGGNTALSQATNASLNLSNVQTNNAGNYSVTVSNVVGVVTSSIAVLVVHTTNDPVYSIPDQGWAYLYTGNAASNSVTASLDGTWNRVNGDDSWGGDKRGAGATIPGGVGATNGILTIEDAVVAGTGSSDNRRYYMTHNLAQETAVTNGTTLLNDGVTLTFRARLTPPTDPLIELTNAPNGFVNIGDGKGMFGIRQAGSSGMLISFSLNQAVEDLSTNTSFNFGHAGLHMNNLNGDVRSPNVDPGEGGTTNLLSLDSSIFHEFWITIQDNGAAAGTHRVSIYLDGSKTPTIFNVTAGTGSDTPATNYLALGLPSTPQVGAVDIDFFGYKPGVLLPSDFNDPAAIVSQPTNQTIAAGQMASFSVGASGATPLTYQWYKNGAVISQATNATYTPPPATAADGGAAFVVVVGNLLNSVTSSPPAILNLLAPPVLLGQPQSVTVTNGDPAGFSVTVQSAAAVTYGWRFNGANLAVETNASLSIGSTQPLNAGAYDVVVSNNGGSVTSAVAILTINSFDFGDAPAPYPTLLANNGARHLLVPGVYLGAGVDPELNGQPNGTATGDDLAGSADEDGVRFTTTLFVGRTGTVQVVASTNGFLDAWIDFNGNGSWADGGDQIFASQALIPGTNSLNFLVPANTTATSSFARFRFSIAGGLSYDGPAASGEVEDYAVSILPAADLAVSTVASSEPAPLNSNLVYSITIFNAGPSAATGVTLTNLLPSSVSFVSALPSQGSCGVSGGVVTCALGSMNANNPATVTITVVPTSTDLMTNIAIVVANEIDFVPANNQARTVSTIEIAPAISVQPVSLTVTQGNNLTFSVVATGTAPLLYQWRRSGTDLSGKTNTSLAINNAQPADAGAYTVQVSNRVGGILSAPATLTVLVPPLIVAQPQSQTNLAGGLAILSVTASGTEPLLYQWFFNQTNSLPTATNALLTLTNVQKSQAGDYTVTVRNSAGVIASQIATLTVLEMDFGDAPDPGYPTLLASNGARHRLVPGVYLGSTVDFEPNGQPSGTASGDDNNGSADEDGVTFMTPLFAGQLASITVVASTNGFLDAWIDFNANGSWADAGDQILTNLPLAAGTNLLSFRVPALVTTTNSFARFRFSSEGNLSFDGEALSGEVEDYALSLNAAADLALRVAAQPNPVAVGSNLTYAILVTNSGPSTATGVSFNDSLPDSAAFISVVSSAGSCANVGNTVNCSLGSLGSGNAATVLVTCSATAAGLLTNISAVTAVEHELTPLDNTVTLVVGALDYPAITAQPQGLTVTNGGGASFSVGATGTALNYQWRFNGTDLAGASNATLVLSNVQAVQAGNYTLLVSNGVGSVLSDPAGLTVLVTPQITVQPQSQVVLAGSMVVLSVSAVGTEPLHYQWRLNGTDLIGETGTTLSIASVQPAQQGAYTVQVNNIAGSVVSDAATITVLVPPAISQQPQSRTDNAGGQSSLSVIASGSEPLVYQWYLNDGNALAGKTNATLTLTNVQKSQSGNYYAVITNGAGTITSAVAILTIREVDFGDAPDALGYPTLMIFNGARHLIVPGIHLGATIDFEPDGQPNANATGDDLNGVNDDDGVTFTSPLRVGQTAGVDVIASTNGFLDAWIDFNDTGSWGDSGDQIFTSQPLVAGTNHLTFSVPALAVASNTFARFRFSTAGNLSFDGTAQDGEVEDYAVTIVPMIDLAIQMTDSPDPVVAESNLTYTVAITNRGPSTASGITMLDQLPSGASFVAATSSQGACTNAGGNVSCTLGNLASGKQALITIVVTPHRPGVVSNLVTVAAREVDTNPADNQATQMSTVVAVSAPFVNTDIINVPDRADGGPVSTALPYPSTIFVSGLTATVYKVTATLSNLTHTFPADLDVLLVGPQGQSVILMSDAGTFPIANVTLTFDDASPLTLDAESIVSETFKPTNRGSEPDTFPGPAPDPPYGAALSVFQGTDPNGVWSLYVVDDQFQDSGFIANGWSLNFAILNPISDLSISSSATPDPVMVGSNLVYTFTVRNGGPASATGVTLQDPLPPSLTLVSISSSQGSCTNQNGVITCTLGDLASGAAALVTVTAVPTLLGAITNTASILGNEIDLNFSNNVASSVTTARLGTDLSLSVSSFPQPLQFSMPANYTLTVTNRGPNAATAVHLTGVLPEGVSFASATSSQGSCSNAAGTLLCDLGDVAANASAVVTIVGTPTRTGLITNIAMVTSYEFDLNLADNVATDISTVAVISEPYSNTGALGIAALGTADPYPSSIQVSGLTGAIYQVTATLSNLTHPFPADLDMLLVGPRGQKVLLMSDAGSSLAISNLTLTFSDTAPASLPATGQIVSGLFKPTDYGATADVFPAPAPAGPYATVLSVFADSNPNGLWSLYVIAEQTHGGTGVIAGGWSLTFATVYPIADLSIGKMESPDPVAAGSNLTYTIFVTNSGPATATSVTLVDPLPANVNLLSALPSQGSCTNQNGAIICALGNLESGSNAVVSVVVRATLAGAVTNTASVLSLERDLDLANNSATVVTTIENAPAIVLQPQSQTRTNNDSVTLDVTATGTGPLLYQWQHSGADILNATNHNLVLSNLTLADAGDYRVRVSNPVGSGLSTTATLTVLSRPTISAIADQATDEDTQTLVSFTVGDVETPAGALSIAATSSNPSLVASSNLLAGGSGNNRTLTIQPAPNQFGTATITVTVTDGDGISASSAFLLTVRSVNDPPTLNPPANVTINEDAGLQVVNLTGISAGATNENQTLAFSVVNSNPGLLANLTVNYTNPATTGALLFETVPNAFGTALITLVLSDGQSSIERSFTVTVNPVNDPPTLDPIGDVSISANAGPQMIVLTGITSGAANENNILSVNAVSSNLAIIPNPTVDYTSPNGFARLRFTPQSNTNGVATITVTVNDGQPSNNIVQRTFSITVSPGSHFPTISTLANQLINENVTLGPLSFTVGDTETPATSLLVTASSSNPGLVLNSNILLGGSGSNRTVSIVPSPDQFGVAVITLTVANSSGGTASTAFQVTVNIVNHTPALNPIANLSINEDAGAQTVSLTGINSGASNENQILTVSAISSNPALIPNPAVIYTTPSSTGTLSFAPLLNATGVATIFVTVNDGQATNNAVTNSFTVTVNPVNDPPTLDSIGDLTINEDAGLQTLTLTGISSGAPNESQTLVVSANSSNPSLIPIPTVNYTSANTNATLSFAPLTNANGTATISVTVNDGGTSNNLVTRTFTVTVNPVNDPPTLGAITNQTVLEDTPTGPIPVAVADVDSPLASLVYSATSSNPALAPVANIVFDGAAASPNMTITPAANQSGTATITVRVSDGQASASTSFLLTVTAVNDPPTISSIPNQTMNEDTSLSVAFVIGDLETAASNLTVTATSSNGTLLPATNVVLAGSDAVRTVTFLPVTNQFGTSTITLVASDGAATVSNSFLLTVAPVNDPPTLAAISNLTIPEHSSQIVALTGIGAGAANEADTLTITAISSNPALIPNPAASYTNGTSTGLLSFTAVAGAVGTATVTVTVNDGQPTNNIVTRSFAVTVTPTTGPPSISAIPDQAGNEDTPITIPFTVSDAETASFRLAVTATSTNTALVANTNIFIDGNGTNRTVTLVPTTNQFGATRITLTVSDGSATASNSFNVTFNSVNDPPTLDPISDINTNVSSGNTTFIVSLGGISSGATNENQILTVTAASSNTGLVPTPSVSYTSPGVGGSISFRQVNGVAGSAVVTVTVNDGQAANNTFSRSFVFRSKVAGNTAPSISSIANVVTAEDTPTAAVPFTIGDSATPAALLTLAAQSSNTNLAPVSNIVFGGSASNRTVTISPALNQFGTSTITVSVIDTNFGAISTSFLLTVNPVNDAPTVSAIANQTINPNTAAGPIPFTVGDVETPAGNLTVTGLSSNPSLVPNTNIVFGGSGANRAVLVTPVTNQSGSATITLTVGDGSTNTTTSFLLTVQNTPPGISSLADQTINENAATAAIAFTIGDFETPATNLVMSGSSSNPTLVPNANIVFGGNGSNRTVTVTPAATQFGFATITVTVTDGSGGSASASFQLTVNPVNNAPAFDAITNVTINENAGTQSINLTGISPGPNENQVVAFSAASSNPALIPNPTVNYSSPAGTGTLTFLPVPGVSGTSIITVTANDGQTLSNTFSRAFTVTVNPLPRISAIADQTINEDTSSGAIAFTVSDALTPSASLSVTGSSSNPALLPNANLTIGGAGTNRTITVRPATNQFGFTVITLVVANTNGNTATNTFVLTVNPVNDPPTLNALGNLTINEDAGVQTVSLTGISPGPANEFEALAVTAASSNPALIPNPSVTYTNPATSGSLIFAPLTNATGSAVITVTVNDQQASNNLVTRTFTVTVTPSNDPPVISAIAGQVTTQNTMTGPIPFTIGDVETTATALTLSANSSNPTLLPNANITFGGSGSNRTVNLLPATNQSGAVTVTVTVSDGLASASNAFVLTVNIANTPPTISSLADQSINEDTSVGPIAFTVNDVESPAASLTMTGSSSNPGLVSSANFSFGGAGTNRTVTITPLPDQFGTGVVTLTVTDPNGAAASASFTLVVKPVNDSPTLNPIADLALNEDSGSRDVVLSGISSGAANENQTLVVTATNNNSGLFSDFALTYSSPDTAGVLTFRPVANASGSALVTVTVNDGGSSNNVIIRSFTVSFQPVNDPPAISPIPDQVTAENTPTSISFTINDVETAASNLVVTAFSLDSSLVPAANISVVGSGNNRAVSLLPAANQLGTTIIVVNVSDGTANTSASFFLTVSAQVAPALQISRIDTTNQISFFSQNGKSYVLEASGDLNGSWAPLSTVPGTGALLIILDSSAPGPNRFYRLRIE